MVVHTDASIDGYGAVLLQRLDEDNLLHPVYFEQKDKKGGKELHEL